MSDSFNSELSVTRYIQEISDATLRLDAGRAWQAIVDSIYHVNVIIEFINNLDEWNQWSKKGRPEDKPKLDCIKAGDSVVKVLGYFEVLQNAGVLPEGIEPDKIGEWLPKRPTNAAIFYRKDYDPGVSIIKVMDLRTRLKELRDRVERWPRTLLEPTHGMKRNEGTGNTGSAPLQTGKSGQGEGNGGDVNQKEVPQPATIINYNSVNILGNVQGSNVAGSDIIGSSASGNNSQKLADDHAKEESPSQTTRWERLKKWAWNNQVIVILFAIAMVIGIVATVMTSLETIGSVMGRVIEWWRSFGQKH